MKITPLGANLLIAPIAQGSVSKGGLLLPAIASNKLPYRFGDVVAAGSGAMNAAGVVKPPSCKEGDVVMYAKNAGLEFPIEEDNGERVMVLLGEQYVLGIVHGLKRPSTLTGVDGRLLMMEPGSKARPDVAYENESKIDEARRDGWIDTSPMGVDEYKDDPIPYEGPR